MNDAPVWTRLFKVRPRLGGENHGLKLPFVVRLDTAGPAFVFGVVWTFIALRLGVNSLVGGPVGPLVALSLIIGPIYGLYKWLELPTADNRDRVEQLRQGAGAIGETVLHRWRTRRGPNVRRNVLKIEIEQ